MQKEPGKLEKRPPVVVILGHVDHGKTTLLDYIRKTNVAGDEAGGITQCIGAYEITHNSKHITFIDTPGHEAFSKMRSRGVQVADVAVLVVAVDDGVQPQTKEAIKIIREVKIPFIVALNKIDKPGVDINKVKNDLTAEDVLLEGYGGSVSVQPISAKTGEGIPELLDLILLTADLTEVTFSSEAPAEGVILETECQSRRGLVASAIVKNGTLRVGDFLSAGDAVGKVKGLEDFHGTKIKEAIPSMPVIIMGFETLPTIGERFAVGVKRASAAVAPLRRIERAPAVLRGVDERSLHLILKADVSGSLETLSQIVAYLPKPTGITVKVMEASVGDITDGDVKLAISVNATIIGFRVKATKAGAALAEVHAVPMTISEIVYELTKALEEKFKVLDKTIIKGDLEILEIFGKKGATSQIVGGKVVHGALDNQSAVAVERRGNVIGEGKILNLQSQKKDVPRVETGSECGLLIDAAVELRKGDHLIVR